MILAFALAAQIEIGAGVSHTTLVEDQFWVEEASPHILELNSIAWRVGILQPISSKWSLEASYAGNGVQHSNALATLDSNYDKQNHVCLNNPCRPLYRYVGQWRADGVSVNADWHWRDWSIGTGPYLYSPRSTMTVTGYSEGTPHGPGVYQSSGTLHVGTDTHLAYQWRSWSIRGDSYLVCPDNRCKSEKIPPYIGRHLFVITINWSH